MSTRGIVKCVSCHQAKRNGRQYGRYLTFTPMHAWIGTRNICRGMRFFNLFVNAEVEGTQVGCFKGERAHKGRGREVGSGKACLRPEIRRNVI